MRNLSLITVFLVLAAGPAVGLERLDLETINCEAAMSLTGRDDGVVLRQRSGRVAGLTLFQRYVRHSGQCFGGDIARPVDVQASDGVCALMICESHSNTWRH